ncbi:hypothetical protein CAOG_06010 [Capsaspora owczarzaki ATCC 30864]|uniref:Phospholipase/carboxylesterase/thioesterase domain-containing protein n=1 Tax=Capsaspora owczarzaki (strain ATCC 30864) TaxID=595528 RepID=A0A0D2VVQ6_CAPO3|nr:hypothetical protein CAOG_06010 [Capsaspora owczarzaki ATCC 30864]KJE95567.1 hypothetical protein CAOG_006010 [Capsaspora owczarzaki ATCC 30864]|eukprot:XP_004345600.1 hypothetical protein CAOG_06010 [Capsaspora owczarzaki ATCC 30864]
MSSGHLRDKRQVSVGLRKPHVQSSDIPSPLYTFQYASSRDGIDSNLLILLHGMGDKCAPFFKFAERMQLPQTAILALQAPVPIMDFGFCWFESFDEDGELLAPSLSRYQSLKAVREGLESLINDVLVQPSFGWQRDRIFLLGFAQGGTVALDLALHGSGRLAGVISISGTLTEEELDVHVGDPVRADIARQTPILLTHGTKDEMIPIAEAHNRFDRLVRLVPEHPSLRLLQFPKGCKMIDSPEEMRAVMTFFSERLYLRNLAMENTPGIIPLF